MHLVEMIKVLEEGGELHLQTTPVDWDRFGSGPLWGDMRKVLSMMIASARDEMETIGKEDAVTLQDFAFLQGQCYAIRSFLEIPERIVDRLKESDEGEQTDG
ncbi:hypothetical protein HN911_07080 [Candidatus Bathyarchaeota archaeon]|jgi:hypothetical protein|nr:hypothetical protein [Candidatus Bathyarchaeota archaeon]